MTNLHRSEWPERRELVLATVKNVENYGAYVTLEEYGDKRGFLHRNEISTSWVRNIRNHVREGQKLVLKVLRVDPNKGHIDLSKKRVSKRERIEKIYTFKHERKVDSLLHITSEKLQRPIEEIIREAVIRMEEKYGDVYTALEEASRQGQEPLLKIGVPADIAQSLAELAQERIKTRLVEVKGTLQLTSTKPDGLDLIKKSLRAAQATPTPNTAKIHIYTITPPKYRLKVEAEDYKQAEKILGKATDNALKTITKIGGEGSFQRER
jgi:translation initiation factor 2 subunit 1